MVGELFGERYQILAELGRGGMGIVYRAHDTLLARDVAVKLLSVGGMGTQGRARLLHEARAAARLNHPNIIAIYDAGEAAGFAFVIMELLEGLSLDRKRLPGVEDVLHVTRQICRALDHAHTHGLVHRDLKPENIIVDTAGLAKLTDFGLARAVASRLTGEGQLTGTVFWHRSRRCQRPSMDAPICMRWVSSCSNCLPGSYLIMATIRWRSCPNICMRQLCGPVPAPTTFHLSWTTWWCASCPSSLTTARPRPAPC